MRTHEQRIALYAAYARRVAALDAAAWDRLRSRCAEFNGPSFRALIDRAQLAAKPYEMALAKRPHATATLRGIANVSRAVQTGLALTFELVDEFGKAHEPWRRTESTGKPSTDAYVDASFAIESALAPLEHTDRGVATAVRAAGQAVLRHDSLDEGDFAAVYSFVEREIPFAELEQ